MNTKTHTYKVLIEKLLEEKKKKSLPLIQDYMKNIKSRGLKQRLGKKIKIAFNIKEEKKEIIKTVEKENIENISKTQKNVEKLKEKNDEKNKVTNKVFEQIKKIKNEVKNKTKLKRKAQENDDFDKFAEDYKNKIQKKVKWSTS